MRWHIIVNLVICFVTSSALPLKVFHSVCRLQSVVLLLRGILKFGAKWLLHCKTAAVNALAKVDLPVPARP